MLSENQELLMSWEEIYKRGHLTFWVLLALSTKPQGPADIMEFIEKHSRGLFSVNSQSLHRALRRFHEAGFLEIIRQSDGRKKVYKLSQLGGDILNNFLKRNIIPLYTPALKQFITEASS